MIFLYNLGDLLFFVSRSCHLDVYIPSAPQGSSPGSWGSQSGRDGCDGFSSRWFSSCWSSWILDHDSPKTWGCLFKQKIYEKQKMIFRKFENNISPTWGKWNGIKWWLSDSSFHWISWKDIIPNLLRFLRDDIDSALPKLESFQKHQIQNSMSLHYRREYRLLAIFPSPDLSKLKSPGSHSYQLVRCVLWQAATGTYHIRVAHWLYLVIIEAADCQKSEQAPRASSGFQQFPGALKRDLLFLCSYALWFHILSLKTFQSVTEICSSGSSFCPWAPAWLFFLIFNFDIGIHATFSHQPPSHPPIPAMSPCFFPLPRKASQPPASTARPLGSPKAQTNYAQTKRHRPTARSVSSKISKTPLEVLSCEISWYKKAPEKRLQEEDSHL